MHTIKRCGCGRSFTQATWDLLPLTNAGHGPNPIVSDDETGTYRTELRDCLCGSSIAVETKDVEAAP